MANRKAKRQGGCSRLLSTRPSWGIYCGAREHKNEELKLTDLERFTWLDRDLPSLLATTPQGNVAWRSAKGQPWGGQPTEVPK